MDDQVTEYLREENRVLRGQLGGRRLRLTDYLRRRPAANAGQLSRQVSGFFPDGLPRRRLNYVFVGKIELGDLKDVGWREPAEPSRQMSCQLIDELLP